MFIVKAWIDGEWAVIGYFPSMGDATLYQDRIWLEQPSVITEIEDRSLFS